LDNLIQRVIALSPAKRAALQRELKDRVKTALKQGIPVIKNRRDVTLSFAQQRLWFLDQLAPGSTAYNMARALRLRGPLNIAALEQSFNEIVRRHETLRTTFAAANGQPVQVIAPPEPFRLPVVDLTELPPGEREAVARRLATEEAQSTFDLAKGPLFRAKLLRLGEEDHVLLRNMHHIISDGWSLGVFHRELGILYNAFCSGKASPLPELPIQYSDFAVWQRQRFQGKVLESQLSYWKQKLAGLSVLELPTDYRRPAVQTSHGAAVSVRLSRTVSESLKTLSRREGVTLFMTLLAALKILLRRYTRQDDIVLGAAIAGRSRAAMSGLIGFFINALVLRTDLSGNPTFRELLARVREVCLGAYAHQDMPFEKLVEELQPERDLSRHPLFQTLFNMHNLPVSRLAMSGLTVEEVLLREPASKFDLTLYAPERDGAIQLRFVYNCDLFTEARIVGMLDQLKHLLGQIVERPDERIDRFSLVTPAARAMLPDPTASLDDSWLGAVHELFSQEAKKHPDKIAVEDSREAWSYRELDLCSNRLARYLLASGVGREDIVAVHGCRSAGLVWALLGILKAGAAFCVLDPAYPAQRLKDYLKLAIPKGLIQVGDAEEPAGSWIETVTENPFCCRLTLPSRETAEAKDFLAEYSQDDPKLAISKDDLAYVIFTSGSTGKPKGVEGVHGPLTHFLPWLTETFGLSENDRFTFVSSLSTNKLQREIFTALCVGGTLYIPEADDIGRFGRLDEWMRKKEISVVHLTPALAQMLDETARASIPTVRQVFFGGDLLQMRDVDRAQKLMPQAEIANFYNSSETQRGGGYTFIAKRKVENEKEVPPLGCGVKDVQLLVLNQTGQMAGVGELGEICVRSPHMARGYLGDQELTKERFTINPFTCKESDRIYRTGEQGRYIPNGSVEFVARGENHVSIRGFRVELGEIESVLKSHPGISDAVVSLQQMSTDHLIAYLVSKRGANPSVEAIRTFLKARLPNYMIPAAFMILDSLPLTPTGKVNRRDLPAFDLSKLERETTFVAPRTPVERTIAEIWKKVLGLEKVSLNSNFFDLGGHSLLAVRLFAQIEKIMGKNLPLAALFQGPTIEQLAKLITRQEWSAPWESLVAIQPAGSKPPFFCVHAHDGSVLFWRDLARHLGSDQPFYALQPQGLDGRQSPHNRINEMAAHYIEELRTLQPEGPYFIGGHCIGGLIAFEMAQQLHAQGERVGLLALFDSYAPRRNWSARSSMLRRYRYKAIRLFEMMAGLHVGNLLILEPKDRPTYVKGKFNKALYKLYMSLGCAWVPAARNRRMILNATSHAARKYSPKIYPGKITLFRATQLGGGIEHDPQMGWGGLAGGGLETHLIPGYHAHIVLEPRVRVLAEKLTACLDRGQAGALSDEREFARASSQS
jgi:amino acid adenylation domain-containing protein